MTGRLISVREQRIPGSIPQCFASKLPLDDGVQCCALSSGHSLVGVCIARDKIEIKIDSMLALLKLPNSRLFQCKEPGKKGHVKGNTYNVEPGY